MRSSFQRWVIVAPPGKRSGRQSERGAAIILYWAFGLFLLLPLGLATFEVWRYVTASSQLQFDLDAAALCGTANLLRQHNSQGVAAIETNAITAAELILNRNTVLGTTLVCRGTTLDSVPPVHSLSAGQVALNATFVDSNRAPIQPGEDGVKGLRLTAEYGYKPFCGPFIGLGCLPIQVTSEGGIPPIDLVLCFDVSASMDDGTNITTVERFWDGAAVAYQVPQSGSGNLLNVVKPAVDGTKVNVVGPENLSMLSSPLNQGTLYFSESQSSPIKGLRARVSGLPPLELGAPPGNFNPANPNSTYINGHDPASSGNAVTDLVVNLDGNSSFGGWTDPSTGLQFPNVQTLVEAARGNLNTYESMQQSLAMGNVQPAWLPVTAPNAMYQNVYFARAQQLAQPLAAAKVAAIEILRALDQNTVLHAGLVSFSDYIGSDPGSTWGSGAGATTYFIDSNWVPGGTGNFPLPLVPLDAGQPNIIGLLKNLPSADSWLCPPAFAQAGGGGGGGASSIAQLISTLVATGRSNVSAALNEAIAELTNPAMCRPDAEKVILLISDGKPDAPGGSITAAQDCYAAAKNAARQGIKIVAIDVATTSDTNHEAFLEQVATLSKGYYISGSTQAQLNVALQKILTQLVALR